MNFIIFDLELTCWEGDRAGRIQEIIEIGAYKIDPYAHTKSKFNKFVKPVIYPSLSPFCTQLTTINQSMVDNAKPFKDIYKEFIEWSEIDIEPYYLIAWGDKDQQYLFNECKSNRLDTDWLRPYSDLKSQYQRIKKLYEPRGLKHAIESEGWEFDGVQHRAIDDAYNLSKIFIKYFGEWDLHKLEQRGR